jgi:hypothetical protein
VEATKKLTLGATAAEFGSGGGGAEPPKSNADFRAMLFGGFKKGDTL